jgi:chemotaxis response regulator CheB
VNNYTLKLLFVLAAEGGPPVVHSVLSQLPAKLNVPTVISAPFPASEVDPIRIAWDRTSSLSVELPVHSTQLRPGYAYVISRDRHSSLIADNDKLLLSIGCESEHSCTGGCLSQLTDSVAVSLGSRVTVMLTGEITRLMSEAADGIRSLIEHGSRIYYVTEQASHAGQELCGRIQTPPDFQRLHVDEFAAEVVEWAGVWQSVSFPAKTTEHTRSADNL